jgi:replicative DNA helicase
MKSDINPDKTLFDPPLIATLTQQSIERERDNPEKLNIGIDAFGNDFVMARKSKVIGIMGDTSHGKTSLMRFMAGKMCKQLDAAAGEIGLFVTWEDNVEDFGMVDFAEISKIPVRKLYNGDIDENQFNRVLKATVVRSAIPLWVAGHSEMSEERPMLTMSNVFEICRNITNVQKKKIRFIMLDYLQRINRDDTGEKDTRMQFVKIMDMVKNLALSYKVCVFIGTQIRREMSEKSKDRQPQTHWAMETSNFEHSCDGMISIWMPYMSKDVWSLGESLEVKIGVETKKIEVTKELTSIQIIKQKKGQTGIRVFVDFIPEFGIYVKHGTAAEVRAQIKKETDA